MRLAAPETGLDADVGLDMVHREIGDAVRRPGAGDGGEGGAGEAAAGADPPRDLH